MIMFAVLLVVFRALVWPRKPPQPGLWYNLLACQALTFTLLCCVCVLPYAFTGLQGQAKFEVDLVRLCVMTVGVLIFHGVCSLVMDAGVGLVAVQ